MEGHTPDGHNNFGMALSSLAISLVTMLTTDIITGEIVHWFSGLVVAASIFLLNKLMHYLWDKHIEKKIKR